MSIAGYGIAELAVADDNLSTPLVTPTTTIIALLEIEPTASTRQHYIEPNVQTTLVDLEPSSSSREVGTPKPA